MRETQLSLFGGEVFVLPEGGPQGPAVSADDGLPPGPYRLGLLYDYGAEAYMPPFSVVAGDGRTIAGHIPSLKIAVRVRDLLNAAGDRA
jgi:hypothetical protein